MGTGADDVATFDIKGISLSTYSAAGYADSAIGTFEENAATSGANFVALSNVSYVDLTTNVISDAYNGNIDQTAPLTDVDAAIKSAEADGLQVMLKPQLVTSDPAYAQYTSGSWINLVDPNLVISNPQGFFAAYKTYILQWAELAQQDHVAVLSIGNEMLAATKPEYTAYWDDIISSIREVYSGELTYSALLPLATNSSVNEVTQIGFWNKLDFAGFDVYPSLSQGADPSVSSLDAAWKSESVFGTQQDYYAFVEQMAEQAGKPVIFTETGLPSFAGASDRQTSSDGNIGSNSNGGASTVTDVSEQANWWESFFQTWATNTPSWLSGVFVYNNDPEQLGAYGAQNYNIYGKPAAEVVASWYGGKTVIAPASDTLVGSVANDQLYTYGPNAASASVVGPTALAQSTDTIVSVTLTASINSGTAPVIRAIINGHDFGDIALNATDSGYVTNAGIHFTVNQTYTFDLPGLQTISSLVIEFDSAPVVDGQVSSTFFQSVSVDGVPLTADTYTAASGYQQTQALPSSTQGGNSSQWDAGSTSFDPTPWNTAVAINAVGTAADPIQVQGGGGVDTLHVLGDPQDYQITRTGLDTFTLSESSNLGQNISATGIATVVFQDGSVIQLSDVSDNGIGYSASMERLASTPLVNHFLGDPLSDFLIQNAAGTVVVGEVVGGQANYTVVAGLGPEWSFRGDGDFFGDGNSGFLIQNAAGAVVVGELVGGQTTYTAVGGLGPEWKFVGIGDYLGRGDDQFLIENTAGSVVLGEVVNGQAAYTQVGALGPEWKFLGTGDFLGDGKSDFLIQNSSGAVVLGDIVNGQAAYTQVGGLGPEWKFLGTGDFLGDGKSDFLIENTAGAVIVGEVTNGVAQYSDICGLGPEWKFMGAGDFLGEGHDQFLIENNAGAVVVADWANNHIQYTSVAELGAEWVFH